MRKWRAVIAGSIGAIVWIGVAVKAEGTLPAFAQEMLAAHNAVRQRTGVPPLTWSNTLATRAEEWAKTLARTGASRMEGIPGQNIGYTSPPGTAKGSNVVAAWAAEATNYDHKQNACVDPKRRCNHYTQVVWRDSSSLGCAVARDAQRDIWVCNYDPPGNNVAEKPY
jgi:uncharacterized protein YkwD